MSSLNSYSQSSENHELEEYIPSDSIFARFLHVRNIPIYNNNEIELLPTGRIKFESLFEDIRKAKKHIHLEYFNFRSDSIAKEVFTLLAEKAKEGVKVRAMFDDFGNLSNNRPLRKEHLKMLNDRGIEIIRFDPMKFPYINHALSRDHQKIVIIDGEIGYTGGMNIADYYINGLPEIGPWRDMHVRIEGPAVSGLQKAFLDTWNKETKQGVEGDTYFPYGKDSTYTPEQRGKQVAIVQRVPRISPDAVRRAYIEAIDAAEHHIRIVTPYFTPTRSVRKALYRALKRGIKVEIMVSEKCDISFTPDGGFYYANKFRKAGAHIYLYKGGFHHTKVMTVDDRFCTVGSTNLNSRSLRYDYEINAFIFDLQTTYELDEIYSKDKTNSERMTKEYYKKRGVWRNFVGWFAHILTPVI
ncbi:cardiolipin synthase [Bacteroides caecigallinarum]|uniref:cardiolipin synthase n=1 Tax=uncultured Bacteroides sp. TaxID=162156 RepID=UPI0026024085|nr:cardiolipin synthase [uncultured Bacteroides sp.]